jgi:hypothetical protein
VRENNVVENRKRCCMKLCMAVSPACEQLMFDTGVSCSVYVLTQALIGVLTSSYTHVFDFVVSVCVWFYLLVLEF